MMILLLLSIILMVNDYIRTNKLAIDFEHMYAASLIFTILGTKVLNYYINGYGTNMYIFSPLIELLGLKLKVLFLVHSILFLIISISNIGILNS